MQLWPSGRQCDDITTAGAARFGVEVEVNGFGCAALAFWEASQ